MRRPAPGGVRNRPPIRAKACTNLPFRLHLEVVHQFEEDLGARALADGVPRAQDPRRPLVVALEYRGGNKRDQRVCERVLVLEIPDAGEALTHQRDRLIGVPAPERQDGANIQRPGQEPRTGLSKDRHGLVEQVFRLAGVAGRKSD